MPPKAPPHGTPAEMARSLRDELLPDLLAVSMLLTTLEQRIDGAAVDEASRRLIHDGARALDVDIAQVRSLISALSQN